MYRTNIDLPASVRRLSEPVQDLYRAAFNSALDWYGEEAKAHRTAWSAVKNQAARQARSITYNIPVSGSIATSTTTGVFTID